jgi:hypothetical protein
MQNRDIQQIGKQYFNYSWILNEQGTSSKTLNFKETDRLTIAESVVKNTNQPVTYAL